jgi:hypothetical protein
LQQHRGQVWVRRIRIARWYVCITKIPILVNFGRPWNEKLYYILCQFGISYVHYLYLVCPLCIFLVYLSVCIYFVSNWYISTRYVRCITYIKKKSDNPVTAR